jgi:assimilatory nitrate reductase electron transfer subunit
MLKVIGVELVSVGRIDADEAAGERVDVLEDANALRYRKLVIDAEGACAGAILLGFPEEAAAITDAVRTGAPAETVLAPA